MRCAQPIVFDPYSRIPYVQEWNLAVQRQLPRNSTFEAAYVANKGSKLELRVPFNPPFDPGPGDAHARRPFPDLSEGYAQRNIGNSVYHSLQVKFEKMFSQGLGLLGAYTWSMSIDDASSDFGSGILDVRNYGLEALLPILRQGSYFEVDTFGQDFYTPWSDLTAFLRFFCDAGFDNRLFISIDSNWRWENGLRLFEGAEAPTRDPNASKRTYAYMITSALPRLLESGFNRRRSTPF